MKTEEARQHALGYASGREDASKIRTATGRACPEMPAFLAFADAWADAEDRLRREVLWYRPSCHDAYEAWQASGGVSVYDLRNQMPVTLQRLAEDGDAAAATELARRTRRASVSRKNGRPSAEELARYLYASYKITSSDEDEHIIEGTDDHGFTLDAIIDRLSSGMIYATEIKS